MNGWKRVKVGDTDLELVIELIEGQRGRFSAPLLLSGDHYFLSTIKL